MHPSSACAMRSACSMEFIENDAKVKQQQRVTWSLDTWQETTNSGTNMSSASDKTDFRNASASGEIPSFNGDEKAKATDFANYFCKYDC